jgi:hypothetical protein
MKLLTGLLDIITAAGMADINIIPLVWTLPIHAVGQNYTANDTFLEKSVPRINALTQVSRLHVVRSKII